MMLTSRRILPFLSALAVAFIAACSSNELRVSIPSRGANQPSIRVVDLWMDQTPWRYADGGVVSTDDAGAPVELSVSLEIKDHTGSLPTSVTPAGLNPSRISAVYGDEARVAEFASQAMAILVPPKNIPGEATDPQVAIRRNRFRLRLRLPRVTTNSSTCEVTSPGWPQNWTIILHSSVPTRFCIVSSAPTAPGCNGTPAPLDSGELAGLTVMQLEGGTQTPQIQQVGQCQDVLNDNPLPQ